MKPSITRGSRRLIDRVLGMPDLVRAVRALPVETLAALVSRVGVEDAAEIIALTTTDQLTHLFDEDVFDAEDAIDPERFALWLSLMLEAGDAFTAERVTQLPEDMVRAAVHAFAMVLDLDALAVEVADREDLSPANDALEAARTEELLGYLLVAKRYDGWDAVWTTLVAIADENTAYIERLLSRLRDATMEEVEEHGLYEVLTSEEMLVEDAAADREERRARRGYVSASDARAFLSLACDRSGDPDVRDAITAAWFRRLDPSAHRAEPATDLTAVLVGAGVAAATPQLTTGSGGNDPASRFRAAMAELAARAPRIYDARVEELAYLANVLSAGARLGERRYRSIEAVEAAVRTCGLGLARRSDDREDDADVLAARSLDLLFRDGA